jgi:hypothetical protein
VQVHQLFANFGVGVKVGSEGNARQLAFEVGGVAGAVFGMMEKCVRGMQSKELRGRLRVIDSQLPSTDDRGLFISTESS